MEVFTERDIRGAVALVSGGSKGIGANLAEELAKRGVRVISLSRSLPASPVDGVDYRICDLSDRKQLLTVISALADDGLTYIDILVLNAAVMPGIFMPVAAVDDKLEDECFATNLIGAHFLTKLALPLLLASPFKAPSSDASSGAGASAPAAAAESTAPAAGGAAGKRYSAPAPGFSHSIERTVVYVSSSAGFLEVPEDGNGMLAYRASKAGLNGLMVALHALYVDDTETAVRTRGGPGAPKLQRVVSGEWSATGSTEVLLLAHVCVRFCKQSALPCVSRAIAALKRPKSPSASPLPVGLLTGRRPQGYSRPRAPKILLAVARHLLLVSVLRISVCLPVGLPFSFLPPARSAPRLRADGPGPRDRTARRLHRRRRSVRSTEGQLGRHQPG